MSRSPTTSLAPDATLLQTLLGQSAARHDHLCPRQVLGVRIGLLGLRLLGLADERGGLPFDNGDKRLLTIVETDGCAADGIAVATDCAVGHRTLRVVDYGKVAATLVDTAAEQAVRIVPQPDARRLAVEYAPDAPSRWHAYRESYRRMPDELLLKATAVCLVRPIADIVSHPDARATCAACGEEVINSREVPRDGRFLCRACAGDSYYRID